MKTIKINEELYSKAWEIAKSSGYETLDEFVETMLSDIVKENERPKSTDEEEKEIKERLRKLGYLD